MKEVYLTTDWPLSRIEKYGKEITAAMKKIVGRFPDDVTLEGLRHELFSGAQQLWLMLDGEKFEAMALTEIRTNEATGNKSIIISDLAGEFGPEMVPFIEKIEEYGRSVGAHDVRPIGRLGWSKALKKLGYAPVTCFYRKAI
jgi:hypothetical protein